MILPEGVWLFSVVQFDLKELAREWGIVTILPEGVRLFSKVQFDLREFDREWGIFGMLQGQGGGGE
jgi:hypothetical protein